MPQMSTRRGGGRRRIDRTQKEKVMTASILEIPTGTEIIVDPDRECKYLRPHDEDE